MKACNIKQESGLLISIEENEKRILAVSIKTEMRKQQVSLLAAKGIRDKTTCRRSNYDL